MSIEDRVDALEKRVASLESKRTSGATSSEIRPFDFSKLSESWADKEIREDPKHWKGESQVGKMFSQAPVEWLDKMASYKAWKAEMGKKENPPRLKNNGKPWYETDEFDARLFATWGAYKKQQSMLDDPLPGDDAAF